MLEELIGFAAGWASSLPDFDLMPGSARRELELANQALERAAQIVERHTDRAQESP